METLFDMSAVDSAQEVKTAVATKKATEYFIGVELLFDGDKEAIYVSQGAPVSNTVGQDVLNFLDRIHEAKVFSKIKSTLLAINLGSDFMAQEKSNESLSALIGTAPQAAHLQKQGAKVYAKTLFWLDIEFDTEYLDAPIATGNIPVAVNVNKQLQNKLALAFDKGTKVKVKVVSVNPSHHVESKLVKELDF